MTPRTFMTPSQVASHREMVRQAWGEEHGIVLHERGAVTREVRAANVVGEFFKRLWPKRGDEQ